MGDMLKCWEFMKCNSETKKNCIAVKNYADDMCWMIAGTMCGGKPQGSFAEKIGECKKCAYFKYMHG